ncbi:calcium-binding protein [Cupriavidus sp. WKF15]|uniref:calcium-binding protein n=1 Tax=Cupriavidus sp. WKF15 TaxID=3032282 RepID=UPI0023E250F8|nr:calcium-binding protein [Cupriavidus sp. WKF15]WER50674.1 calcium-binding protein [Cupriavidus sp. WKF15]
MEIVVDAYTEEECAMAWYCHLEDSLSFPFDARVRQTMPASPLRAGERFSVTELARDQLCRVTIFVHAQHNQRELVVPLAQLVPIRADQSTRLAVSDWHYWCDQGYSF